MKVLLDGLLPRVVPDLSFQCIAHEGKSDLEESIPRKLRAWREPGVRFVILRDNDGAHCVGLKERLLKICRDAGREDTLVRIVCEELEAWYLGEPYALAEAFENEKLAGIGQKAKFRRPDTVQQPSNALKPTCPGVPKGQRGKDDGSFLSRERNRSPSFQALLSGIDRLSA